MQHTRIPLGFLTIIVISLTSSVNPSPELNDTSSISFNDSLLASLVNPLFHTKNNKSTEIFTNTSLKSPHFDTLQENQSSISQKVDFSKKVNSQIHQYHENRLKSSENNVINNETTTSNQKLSDQVLIVEASMVNIDKKTKVHKDERVISNPLWQFKSTIKFIDDDDNDDDSQAKNTEEVEEMYPLRVPLKSQARRRRPSDPLRKKSSHKHNTAFPAQVFESVCLSMSSEGYESHLQYPHPYWQLQRGKTTLLVLTDNLAKNSSSVDDDDGFHVEGEPPRGWPALDKGIPMVFTTTTPPPPIPPAPPAPPPPKPIWVPDSRKCRGCGKWITPATPKKQTPKKVFSKKIPGGNKAVNDTGAWIEVSWSLLDYEQQVHQQQQQLQVQQQIDPFDSEDKNMDNNEDKDQSGSSHKFISPYDLSSRKHSNHHHGHHHHHHYRARSVEDVPSIRFVQGPSWSPYAEYDVKFVSGADLDPFNQWEWVSGTTHHFQGLHGSAGDALHSLWPAFAIYAHPASVFVPKIDHILIDHGCECMTMGNERNSGCCLHHSHTKGNHCNIHHHLFRIALHGWLEKATKTTSESESSSSQSLLSHFKDKIRKRNKKKKNGGDLLVLPDCDCSSTQDEIGNEKKGDSALSGTRGGHCAPRKVGPPITKSGHYNRTVCFEKLVLTPHRVTGKGKTLRGGDPLTLFGKDHKWSKALRSHLLLEFRDNAYQLFNVSYPLNGRLKSSSALEAHQRLVENAEELMTIAENMPGSPNKGIRKQAYEVAKNAKSEARKERPTVRFLIIGDEASRGKGIISGASQIQTNIMWWCLDNLGPIGMQCEVDITDGMFEVGDEFGAGVRALARVDVLISASAWPLLSIASVFLQKGAAVIEVSPYGSSKIGSPASGHIADGLGVSHCVTGSFGEFGEFSPLTESNSIESTLYQEHVNSASSSINQAEEGEDFGISYSGVNSQQQKKSKPKIKENNMKIKLKEEEDEINDRMKEEDINSFDFRHWDAFNMRRKLSFKTKRTSRMLEEDNKEEEEDMEEVGREEGSKGPSGLTATKSTGVQLTARELNSCLDFFELKQMPPNATVASHL